MAQTSTISLETLQPSRQPSTLRLTSPTPPQATNPDFQDPEPPSPHSHRKLASYRTLTALITTTTATTLTSFTSGLITPALPAIAASTNLPTSLLLWPQSINALTSACTLLICGSLSDVFGAKYLYVLGSFLQAAFILGVGLSKDASQLLVFRALGGLAQSMILPSSVAIVIQNFPVGRRRNAAFAAMGGGQPLGFSVGLVLGGIFADGVGWRVGFYIAAALSAIVSFLAAFGLEERQRLTRSDPRSASAESRPWYIRLQKEIDWLGALIASASLACLCYVLAAITADISLIRRPENISLLTISLLLIPTFVLWEQYQSQHSKPALIPNAFWKNTVFASICAGVFFAWGAFNGGAQLINLWLQLVQRNTAFQTSIRLLPESVVGLAVNILVGAFVHTVRSDYIITGTMLLTLISPLIMAISEPDWVYWAGVFPGIALLVVGPDSLYTISNLVVSKQFPDEAQGLAGGVFNTVAQVGKSVGLALSGVITSSVISSSSSSSSSPDTSEAGTESLAKGYQAGFWLCVALNIVTIIISVSGLRKVGKIGAKEE